MTINTLPIILACLAYSLAQIVASSQTIIIALLNLCMVFYILVNLAMSETMLKTMFKTYAENYRGLNWQLYNAGPNILAQF